MAALGLGDIKKDDCNPPPTTFNLDGLLPHQIQLPAQLGLQLGQGESSVRDLLAKQNLSQVAPSPATGRQAPPTTPGSAPGGISRDLEIDVKTLTKTPTTLPRQGPPTRPGPLHGIEEL